MSVQQAIFKQVGYSLLGLLHEIEIGNIGLPDIQRPFVWNATKVRDLFDSMYRGFPVGYFLFWANTAAKGTHSIGTDQKIHAANLLIVDGQQRLTSLYAVVFGKPVLNDAYQPIKIEIAFRPRDGHFEVANAATKKDPEYIPNISALWAPGSNSYTLIDAFLSKLGTSQPHQPLTPADRAQLSSNMARLIALQSYPFTALEIAAAADEEQVADIFVRINSEGVKLNQADFILTLLSVFWDQGRSDMEQFCRRAGNPPKQGSGPSPFNHFIEPSPDQLLRVSIALAFYRARLQSVYQVLRGKDVSTGSYSPTRRDQQFAQLRETQAKVLDLTNWHSFFECLVAAGFRGKAMISSQNTLLYAYACYLIGKCEYKVPGQQLQKVIGRWFFAALLTGHYTNSPETAMEADLNRLKGLANAQAFVDALESMIATLLTGDFWTITLPNELETSSAQSPYFLAYIAAQNLLDAPVLFSQQKISALLDPLIKPKKKPLENHHLFPSAWLKKNGITKVPTINQVANLALLDWPSNIAISDADPKTYVPQLSQKFNAATWARMHDLHALPNGWENLSYDVFLQERRILMANVIRRGFEILA